MFIPRLAGGAFTAGIHHATDSGQIALFEFLYARTGFGHSADDFVSGHARIGRAAPFIARLMHIRVANAAIQDLNLNLLRVRITVGEGERDKRRIGGVSGVGFGLAHERFSFVGG